MENNNLVEAVRSNNASLMDGIMADVANPNPEQVEHLQNLNEASINQHKGDAAVVSGGIANIHNMFVPKTKTKVREYKKIGRNEPCPCGSGKKYKNCCLNTGKYEKLKELS